MHQKAIEIIDDHCTVHWNIARHLTGGLSGAIFATSSQRCSWGHIIICHQIWDFKRFLERFHDLSLQFGEIRFLKIKAEEAVGGFYSSILTALETDIKNKTSNLLRSGPRLQQSHQKSKHNGHGPHRTGLRLESWLSVAKLSVSIHASLHVFTCLSLCPVCTCVTSADTNTIVKCQFHLRVFLHLLKNLQPTCNVDWISLNWTARIKFRYLVLDSGLYSNTTADGPNNHLLLGCQNDIQNKLGQDWWLGSCLHTSSTQGIEGKWGHGWTWSRTT